MSAPTPISPRSSCVKQMPIEEGFDPVAHQIGTLRELASSDSANPKQLQAAYQSTIMLCLFHKGDNEAVELIKQAEADQIFAGIVLETRAQFYSTVICKLTENGSHAKAHELYKSSITSGVWNNPHHEKAKNALTGVGYTL